MASNQSDPPVSVPPAAEANHVALPSLNTLNDAPTAPSLQSDAPNGLETAAPEQAPTPTHEPPKSESSGPVVAGNPVSGGDARSTLVQLQFTSGQSAGPAAPQPKRFNASDINKKFLGKANTSSGSPSSTPSQPTAKTSGTIARPQVQATVSHPRLVTTKLTASPQTSSTPGPGWSRPSSATPPAPSNNLAVPGVNANGRNLSTGSGATAHQMPSAGKVIHPPLRTAQSLQRDRSPNGNAKPAWNSVKASSSSGTQGLNDFPTAAEVAKGSTSGLLRGTSAKTTESEAAKMEARAGEADAFRGVHLDPNAHHWDEMEEDDDNFLDGVIEFEDGRQYKVDAKEPNASSSPPRASVSPTTSPVRKEDRFKDDFDRSWPRSAQGPSSADAMSRTSSSTAHNAPSPVESSRHLFNERSNRLEPYSTRSTSIGIHPRRQDGSPTELRGNRDLPPNGFQHPPGRPASGFKGREPAIPDNRGRRLSNMGSPPQPSTAPPARNLPGRDMNRPLPPHLPSPSTRRTSSRESRPTFSRGAPSSSGRSNRHPSESPVLSHAAAIAPLSGVNEHKLPDLDEMRKDLMQDAAARAKQRRQQEEEDREKEKERARKKAQELEERLKAAAPKEQKTVEAVNAIIHEAVDSAKSTAPPASQTVGLKEPIARPVPFARQPPTHAVPSAADAPAPPPSLTTESWRSKSNLGTKRPSQQPQSQKPASVSFPSDPSGLQHTLADVKHSELEEVDFSDMGRFVGAPEGSEPSVQQDRRSRRPLASDFFEEHAQRTDAAEVTTWRQQKARHERLPSVSEAVVSDSKVVLAPTNEQPVPPPAMPMQNAPHPAARNLRGQVVHKEATMSSLDDAISRIKGAIVGMHEAENTQTAPAESSATSQKSAPKERFVPPALRPKIAGSEPREVFDITAVEPPRSPKPAWNTYLVRLPKARTAVEPRPGYISSRVYPLRWHDVLSFDPPVEGMNRRSLSLNDILFGRPLIFKGRTKYKVLLPRRSGATGIGARPVVPAAQPPLGARFGSYGSFGKPALAAETSNWRRASAAPKTDNSEMVQTGLDTTSRSPPPEVNSSPSVPAPQRDASKDASVRLRTQPKMPEGSSVAFLRDSKVVQPGSDPVPSVNFVVSSEIEAAASSQATSRAPLPAKDAIISRPSPSKVNGINSSGVNGPTLGVKGSEDLVMPITPPAHSGWARPLPKIKESPSRGPDPEHLKAVWSQTSNKSELRSKNSLQGIADDLTSVPLPFNIQDVKSEDGETPPPSSAAQAASRISLSDVTKAFQQVPSSSSSTPHRPAISPPTTTAPVARPPPANYGYTFAPNPGMRPPYGPYSSPMVAHSPSPTVMYAQPLPPGSPIPARMGVNGQPMYGQPVWMPMPVNGAPPQGSPMMRPMASPYPPQVMSMSYQTPGGQPMYMQQPMPMSMQGPVQGNPANRGRGMAVMSPGMSHAVPHPVPMYGGSPVMMPAGRGQGALPGSLPGAHPGPSQPPSTFAHVPPVPYRPW